MSKFDRFESNENNINYSSLIFRIFSFWRTIAMIIAFFSFENEILIRKKRAFSAVITFYQKKCVNKPLFLSVVQAFWQSWLQHTLFNRCREQSVTNGSSGNRWNRSYWKFQTLLFKILCFLCHLVLSVQCVSAKKNISKK